MLELEEKSLKNVKIFLKIEDVFIFYLIKKYLDTTLNKQLTIENQYTNANLLLIENRLISDDIKEYIELNEVILFIIAEKNEEIYKNKRSNVFYKPLDLFEIINKIYEFK